MNNAMPKYASYWNVLACLGQLSGSETLDLHFQSFHLLKIFKNSKRKCQMVLFIAPKIL